MLRRRWWLAGAFLILMAAAIAEFWSVAEGLRFTTHRFRDVAHLVGACAIFGLSVAALVSLLRRRQG
jgi:hypothetical protein